MHLQSRRGSDGWTGWAVSFSLRPLPLSRGRRRTMVPKLAPTVMLRLRWRRTEAVPGTFQADTIVTDNSAI